MGGVSICYWIGYFGFYIHHDYRFICYNKNLDSMYCDLAKDSSFSPQPTLCSLSFRQMPDGDLINLSLSCFIIYLSSKDTVKGNIILQCRSTRHFNSVNISPQLNKRVVVGRLDYKLWTVVTVLYSSSPAVLYYHCIEEHQQ